MKYLRLDIFVVLFCILLCILFVVDAFGNSVGFSYSRAVNDQNFGVIADYTYEKETFDFEVDGNFQSGDVYKGGLDLHATWKLGAIGIRPYLKNGIKGYSLDSMGRTSDLGLGLVVPIDVVEFEISVFGRDGNPFAPRTAIGVLTDAGFSEDTPEFVGLAGITLAEGIPIKDGSSLNVAVATELDLSFFKVDLRGLFEVLGEGEKAHQILAGLKTSGNLVGSVGWQLGFNVGIQSWEGEFTGEIGTLLTLGYTF